jgi:hypothetical protein
MIQFTGGKVKKKMRGGKETWLLVYTKSLLDKMSKLDLIAHSDLYFSLALPQRKVLKKSLAKKKLQSHKLTHARFFGGPSLHMN